MNMTRFGEFYMLEFYNVSFFGRGWNPEPFRVSGHYTVLISTDLKEFMFYKHSDYGGLTWTQQVEIENTDWVDYEVSFMNDHILKYFSRTGYRYNDGLEPLWENIYESKELIEKWNTYHKYSFNNKGFSGLSPMEGDILEIIALDDDLVDSHKIGEKTEFSFQCSDYWVKKVMRGNDLFKIVDRSKYDWGINPNRIVNKYPKELIEN